VNSYQVIYNSIMLAMDKREVVEAFSRLFKLSPEKAAVILDKPGTVLRSNLDSATAEMYREKLLAIGLDVEVHDSSVRPPPMLPENQASQARVQAPALELAPVEKEVPDAVGIVAGYRGNQVLDFEFSGSGFGYFRIWIVNVFLTVLTLGIYSAWATVRRQQYFYSNTRLDNVSFQYVGTPVQILQGRIIGVALLFCYFGAQALHGIPAMASSLLLLASLPALLVLMLSGRLRFSSWRNVIFEFTRDFSGAYKLALLPLILFGGLAFYRWPMAGMLILLPGFPYWQFSLNRFLVSHATFGGEHFRFASDAGDYYKLYFLKLPLQLALLLVLAGVMALIALGHGVTEQWLALRSLWHSPSPGVSVAIEPVTYAAVLLVAAGAGWLVAYTRASLFNLRYDGLALGKSQLSCKVRTWPLLWLYLSNALAIVLSIGLFIPWARVRMVRYRLSSLLLNASYELDDIVGKALRGNAVGGEIDELFYVDIAP
jgi:uncharacterized membrane protein YjgN (DUF898 family)